MSLATTNSMEEAEILCKRINYLIEMEKLINYLGEKNVILSLADLSNTVSFYLPWIV